MGKTYKESYPGSKLSQESSQKSKKTTKKLSPYNRNEFKRCQS